MSGRAGLKRAAKNWGKALIGKLTFLAVGLVVGIFGMAGFVSAIEWTNRTEFCVNCHSMQINFDEYKASIHYRNRSGAHAQCAGGSLLNPLKIECGCGTY